MILETVQSFSVQYAAYFAAFEIFSVVVFTVEYALRLWTCTISEQFRKPLRGRLRFAATPLVLVDLLAILPFYLPMLIGLDLRFIRSVRLFRIFRMLKMGRYSESLKTLLRVLKLKKEDLLITVFIVLFLLVIASSLMYFIEKDVQPEAFSSIPATMWWGIATLTTVGYGDLYPITAVGKVLGSLISVLGIGLFALPTGILASGFAAEMQRQKAPQKTCPHCGGALNEVN